MQKNLYSTLIISLKSIEKLAIFITKLLIAKQKYKRHKTVFNIVRFTISLRI